MSIQRLATFLVNRRVILGMTALILTCLSIVPASQMTFDQSIESLFSRDDPALVAFRKSKELFGGDEIAMLTYTDPLLETPAGQERIRKLSRELAKVPGLVPGSTQNLADTLDQANLPLVSVSRDELRNLVRGILIGDDNITTAVIARFAPTKAIATLTDESRAAGDQVAMGVPRSLTIQKIRDLAARFQLETGLETHVIGEPIQVQDAFLYVEEDGLWLWIYSTVLLMLVILVLFKSLRWTWLSIAVVLVTVIWTRALLVIAQMQLSMVSSILNSLVTIIGVATVIHLALNFRERRARGTERVKALTEALQELAPAIVGTCATTAFGFLVLVSSDILPIRSFGWMMTLGTMLVIPSIAMCVPIGALLGSADSEVGYAPAEATLNLKLDQLFHTVETAPVRLSIGILILVTLSLVGCIWLTPETDFSKNFRAHTPIVRALDFIERRLGGSSTWEVNFETPEILTEEFLVKVARLAKDLRDLRISGRPALTKVVALSDGESLVPRTFLTMQLGRRLWLLDRIQPEFGSSLYNFELRRMRIILRTIERQKSHEKIQIIEDVTRLAHSHFPESQTTGNFVILSHLIDSLLKNQWMNFVIAGAGIVAMMSFQFGSLTLGLISLVPNVFPIVLVLGTMGWLGFPINIATAMISSVSMGLTVDSSIHFLSGYQRARRQGMECVAALRDATSQIGRALIMANLALISGFLVLTASNFIPLVYFGLLVSVAMFGGLVGNLLMLPLLIMQFDHANRYANRTTGVNEVNS